MADIVKIFNNIMKTPRAKSSSTEPSIKPSMLGTACYRKLYYSYNKVEEDQDFPLHAKRIMTLGTAIGDMLIEEYRKAGIVVDYHNDDLLKTVPEVHGKLCKEFPIMAPDLGIKRGYIDMVAIIDGELWLNEFKSANDNKYKNLKSIDPGHYAQVLPYLYIFNKMLKEGKYAHIEELKGFTEAKGLNILYVNKNSSYMKQFTILKNDQEFIKLVQKIESIKNYTAQNILPPKTPEYCNSCPWASKCQNNKLK